MKTPTASHRPLPKSWGPSWRLFGRLGASGEPRGSFLGRLGSLGASWAPGEGLLAMEEEMEEDMQEELREEMEEEMEAEMAEAMEEEKEKEMEEEMEEEM